MRKTLTLVLALTAALSLSIWLFGPADSLLSHVSFGRMVADGNGGVMRVGLASDGRYRLPVRLDQISPFAVEATLRYEDQFFYAHPGINPFSLVRAVFSQAGGRRIGASTITMQVARLRYGLKTGDFIDKVRQIWLALAIEMRNSKEDILEAYFNLAPYGGNIEGIEAASQIYFHKSAASLSPTEARALAVVPQNPGYRHPVDGPGFDPARTRLAVLLDSSEPPAALNVYSQKSLPFRAPHLAAEMLAKDGKAFIQTCIEPDLQPILERSLAAFSSGGRRFGLTNAAAMLLRWTDMRVVATAGSANYFSREISGQIDGTKIRRSPGSTLKPFIYALALDQGLIHPGTILPDSPRSFGGYDPANIDNEFRGPVSAASALRASRNLPAIILAERLAHPGLYDFLRAGGVNFTQGAAYYGLALVLGGAEVSMRELVALYAMLANKGIWQPLRLEKDAPASKARRLLSPESAWLALHMLERADAYVQSYGRTIPVYYKTGTSNGMRDAWTVGVAGQYVLAVWAGNFDNSSNPWLVGSRAALPVFEEIVNALGSLRRLMPPLATPDSLNLVQTKICPATGDIFRGQCESSEDIWLIPGLSPVRDSGILRPVWIDRASGLRSCEPGSPGTEKIWWEFWPSDLSMIFEKAGIHKPAPPVWLPHCEGQWTSAPAPRITLPKKNVIYRRNDGTRNFRLPLQATTDAESRKVFWYAGGAYLGCASAGEIIYWDAPAGHHVLQVVDEAGKSARQECSVADDTRGSL